MANHSVRRNYYRKRPKEIYNDLKPHLFFGLNAVAGLAAMIALSLVIIFLHDMITQCDHFQAQSVKVNGNSFVSQEKILELSEFYEGINIFAANLTLARKRLIANPWIVDAEIRRSFPFAIQIIIKEQEPLAVLDIGRKLLINTRGEIFKEFEASDPQDLPLVSGLDLSDIGIHGAPESGYLKAVLNVLKLRIEFSTALVSGVIQQIHIDKDLGITVFLSGKVNSIRLGYEGYLAKMERLTHVLTYLDSKSYSTIESIDLNDPDRIIVTPGSADSHSPELKEV